MAKVKYVKFLHRLILHTAAAHAYVSPWSSRFILDALSALDQIFLFGFVSKKEMK